MKFKVIEWDTPGLQWAVIKEGNDRDPIALCPLKEAANMVVSGLNFRVSNMKNLAQGFIEAVDNGEGKLKDRWIGLVKGQQLTTDEAKELWYEVLEAIHRREEMVVT